MTTGEIPQSSALAEATSESLDDYMSKDPETLTESDLVAIVERLRAMRVKWEAAEAAGTAKGRGQRVASGPKATASQQSADDLGL